MRYTLTLIIAVVFGFGTLLNATWAIQKQKDREAIQELKSS